MTWYEVRLADGSFLGRLYLAADQHGAASIHHFFGEPWHPHGPVVRILIDDESAITDWIQTTNAGTLHTWDAGPDEQHFGDAWPDVQKFFEAASRISLRDCDSHLHRKLIHCALNAWGYGRLAELRFAKRMVRGRRRILRHDIFYALFRRRRRCRYGCHLGRA